MFNVQPTSQISPASSSAPSFHAPWYVEVFGSGLSDLLVLQNYCVIISECQKVTFVAVEAPPLIFVGIDSKVVVLFVSINLTIFTGLPGKT